MKKIIGILICIIMFGFISCGKMILPDASLEGIYGTWQLYNTTGGFAGTGIPDLDETKVSIEITSQGKYIDYYEGEKKDERKFEFSALTIGTETQYFIDFKNNIFKADDWDLLIYLENDSLVLSENCADCFGYLYVRK